MDNKTNAVNLIIANRFPKAGGDGTVTICLDASKAP
jgi:hypothetical protein